MSAVTRGIYRHYKGMYYYVECVAVHTEEEKPLVVYRQLYGDRSIWARPLSMWSERVEWGGRLVPRFLPAAEHEVPAEALAFIMTGRFA